MAEKIETIRATVHQHIHVITAKKANRFNQLDILKFAIR